MAVKADYDLIWHIDRATFRFDEPDAYANWKKDRKVFFSFDPTFSDDQGSAVFADADDAASYFEITEDKGDLLIELTGDGPVVTAWVKVKADLVTDLDEDALSIWSSEQGGWGSAVIDLGRYEAEFHWDDGGEWRLPAAS